MNDALDRDELDAWEVAPLDAGFDDRVLAAWDDAQDEPQPRGRSGLLLATAGVVAAAILAVILWPTASTRGDDLVAIRAGASAQVEYAPGSGGATQTAGTATYEVTKGTPFVVHTPAADITVHGTEFTVEMLTMDDTRRRKYLGAGALVMTGAAVAVYVASGEVEVANEHGAVTLEPGRTAVASEHVAPSSEPAPMLAKVPVVKSPAKRSTKSITAREREDVQRRLADALAKRRTGHGSAPAKSRDDDESLPPAEAFGSLDKEYIREVVAEDLVPIAVECYESALQDDPELGGNLVLQFSIVGDESVGGIVEEVSLAEGSTLKHPALAECMTESTATLLFDPPDDGGKVVVTYPFKFEPAEAE